MKNQIKCNNCKNTHKISHCLVKTLPNRKYKFVLPCGRTVVKSNINFRELFKTYLTDIYR